MIGLLVNGTLKRVSSKPLTAWNSALQESRNMSTPDSTNPTGATFNRSGEKTPTHSRIEFTIIDREGDSYRMLRPFFLFAPQRFCSFADWYREQK